MPTKASKRASSTRLDKLALFRLLGYEPHPGQLDVHRSRAPRRVLACGVRWGKSTCAAMEAVAAILEPCEESRGWIVAPTYELTTRIFLQIQGALTGRLSHRIREINAREHRVVVCNLGGGVSEVRAKSADNAVSLLGEGLNWVIVDEAARMKAEIWESHLSLRLLDRNGWALLLSTPRGGGWFHQLFRRGQGTDPAYESWNEPTWANPALESETIERERGRLPEAVFRQEFAAEFLIRGDEPCDHCGQPSPTDPSVVFLGAGEELATCTECGREVGEDGRSLGALWPDGRVHLTVVRLHFIRRWVPEDSDS